MNQHNQTQDPSIDTGDEEPQPQSSSPEPGGEAPHRLGDGSPAVEPRRGEDADPQPPQDRRP